MLVSSLETLWADSTMSIQRMTVHHVGEKDPTQYINLVHSGDVVLAIQGSVNVIPAYYIPGNLYRKYSGVNKYHRFEVAPVHLILNEPISRNRLLNGDTLDIMRRLDVVTRAPLGTEIGLFNPNEDGTFELMATITALGDKAICTPIHAVIYERDDLVVSFSGSVPALTEEEKSKGLTVHSFLNYDFFKTCCEAWGLQR